MRRRIPKRISQLIGLTLLSTGAVLLGASVIESLFHVQLFEQSAVFPAVGYIACGAAMIFVSIGNES